MAQKTAIIADDKLAQKYLDVCFCFNSCGKCTKCIRTLVTLDILGKTDLYRGIFDIDYFKKHREDAYFQILKTKDGDEKEDNAVFAKDLYRMAKEKGIIPEKSLKLYSNFKKEQRHVEIKKRIKNFLLRK